MFEPASIPETNTTPLTPSIPVDRDTSDTDWDVTEPGDDNSDGTVDLQLREHMHATEHLSFEIEHLMNLAGAIEQYGISPGLMLVADREGLLSNAFPVIPATETLQGSYRPDSPTSTAALEGVLSAVKSKISEWSARAAATVKNLANRAISLVRSGVSGATALVHWVGHKSWSATKAAGATVKAHPYKTIATVLATIAAVAGVIALIWAFPASAATVGGWVSKVRTAIASLKFPFGSIATGSNSALEAKWVGTAADGTKMFVTNGERLSALGWTKEALTGSAKGLVSALSTVGRVLARLTFHPITNAVAGIGGYVAMAQGSISKRLEGKSVTHSIGHGFKQGVVTWFRLQTWAIELTALLLFKIVRGGMSIVHRAVHGVANAACDSAEPAAA